MTHVQAEFSISKWDEHPFDEGVGVAKLTRATVRKEYSGDVEGSSVTEWLMAYAPDNTATFVGIERIRGKVDGHCGSLVLRHVGDFRDGAATADLSVVSGTDELAGVTGSGSFTADPAGSLMLSLHFEGSD